jgi:hypothetical protein
MLVGPNGLPQRGGVDPVQPDLVLAVFRVQQRDCVAAMLEAVRCNEVLAH